MTPPSHLPDDRLPENLPSKDLSPKDLPPEDLPPEEDAPWISDDLIPDELPSEGAGNASRPSPAGFSPSDSSPSDSSPSDSRAHSADLFPLPSSAAPSSPPSAGGYSSGGHSAPGSRLSGETPLPLVETAFLASAASLMWLVNTYFPPGPLLRILFPLPIALVYLRWNLRTAWMAAIVSGLLLTILLGPTRSIFFVMPYGFLGVQLGCLWKRRARWELSILTGGLLVALGTFFRIWLLSILAGEDLWGYLVAQMTQLIDWSVRLLTNWGWIGLGSWGQPSLQVVAIAAVLMVLFASVVYLFTVHLAAWLVLERLGVAMPEPPGWVQVLLDEG